MKKEHLLLAFLIGLIIAISACGSKTPTPSVPSAPPTLSPPKSPIDSPLQSTSGSSPLSAPTSPEIIPFQLDKPILAGATVVTGRGPAGVPILLQDVTFAGPVLASGEIDQNGRFELTLGEPLEARHRIGVTISDLSGTSFEITQFTAEYNGDGALNVPQIGFYFDTYMIQE